MPESLELSVFLPASPDRLYSAWLDSGEHGAWEGYISGRTLELEPNRRIVQARPRGPGTELSLAHTMIPDEQAAEYEKGWNDYYFEPMKVYFSGKKPPGSKA